MQVVILKRLPRFDRGSDDILNIKSSLSTLANGVYDQLWIQAGSPKNIVISEVDLNIEKPGYLKNLIYGKSSSDEYDGIRLQGSGAYRHLNYRVKQALQPLISATFQKTLSPSLSNQRRQSQNTKKVNYANVVRGGQYAIPTANRFAFLG